MTDQVKAMCDKALCDAIDYAAELMAAHERKHHAAPEPVATSEATTGAHPDGGVSAPDRITITRPAGAKCWYLHGHRPDELSAEYVRADLFAALETKLSPYERPILPPNEAAGCVCCDTCHGFRSVGHACQACIVKVRAYDGLKDCFDRLCLVADVKDEGHLGFDQDLYRLEARLASITALEAKLARYEAAWMRQAVSSIIDPMAMMAAMAEAIGQPWPAEPEPSKPGDPKCWDDVTFPCKHCGKPVKITTPYHSDAHGFWHWECPVSPPSTAADVPVHFVKDDDGFWIETREKLLPNDAVDFVPAARLVYLVRDLETTRTTLTSVLSALGLTEMAKSLGTDVAFRGFVESFQKRKEIEAEMAEEIKTAEGHVRALVARPPPYREPFESAVAWLEGRKAK